MHLEQRIRLREKRIWRIRRKVVGRADRPRLCVNFTNQHIYVQAIDDFSGRTVFALSTMGKDIKGEAIKPNREGATRMGQIFGERAKAAGVEAVVFDRHGRPYHGRVKDFADAARGAGLQF